MQKIKFLFVGLLPMLSACDKTADPTDNPTATEILYTMPDESEPHTRPTS